MPRKIIKLHVIPETQYEYSHMVAECDDGTVWEYMDVSDDDAEKCDYQWECMPLLPQYPVDMNGDECEEPARPPESSALNSAFMPAVNHLAPLGPGKPSGMVLHFHDWVVVGGDVACCRKCYMTTRQVTSESMCDATFV